MVEAFKINVSDADKANLLLDQIHKFLRVIKPISI